jgi:hypothetical protein
MPGEVHEVQTPARPQHTPHLGQGALLNALVEVVEHQGGQHPVDAPVRIGQLAGTSEVPLHVEPVTSGLPPGTAERERVGVEPDDVRLWVPALDEEREVARAGTDLQHLMARCDPGLVGQPTVHGPHAQQAGEGVVDG